MADKELLASCELFAEMTNDELDAIAASAQSLDLGRGDVLFREGDDPECVYIVESGRVAITSRSPDGRESVFALMERGDVIGEMALFDGLGRSAEARVLEPSTISVVDFEPLRAVYDGRPALLWSAVALLAGRIRSMDSALADSVFLDVTGRTAKRLLELAGGEDHFSLPVTQEELAGLVGASRERVNKAIASFVRLGWIDQQERRYRITNREQLELRAM